MDEWAWEAASSQSLGDRLWSPCSDHCRRVALVLSFATNMNVTESRNGYHPRLRLNKAEAKPLKQK